MKMKGIMSMKLRFYTCFDRKKCSSIINGSVNNGNCFNYFMGECEQDEFWLRRTNKFYPTRTFKGTIIQEGNVTVIEGKFIISLDAKILSSLWYFMAIYLVYKYLQYSMWDLKDVLFITIIMTVIGTIIIFAGKLFGKRKESLIINFIKNELKGNEHKLSNYKH